MIQFFFGFLLLLITGVGGFWFQRGVRKRMKELGETCPLCLSDSFKNTEVRRCPVVLNEDIGDEGICNFNYQAAYRELQKLSFATLGHPSSGKTFWLALCFNQIILGQDIPDFVHMEEQPAEGTHKIEEILKYILEDKMHPEATDPGIMPRPVLFNFRDRDPFGASNELISFLDFSGELLQDLEDDVEPEEGTQLYRALMADGFLYFLDPMLGSTEQTKSFRDFRNALRKLLKLSLGAQAHTPVAVCISKIDIIGCMEYANERGAVGKFYEKLSEIGTGCTMEKIRQRSDAVKELLPFMWPDWEIERQIKDFFVGRIMFFPTSPIGIGQPFENDRESIEDRNIEPFLIVEPMLWLVHMTGHLVLDEMPLLSRMANTVVPKGN